MFNELVKIGNRAKAIEDFRLANLCFAVALDKYFDLPPADRNGTQDGPPKAGLTWETNDEYGEYPPEIYYDLLVINTAEADGDGWVLHSLCIPIPILKQYASISALKAAEIVERYEHGGREYHLPEDNEVEALWGELLQTVSKKEIVSAAEACLDLEECGFPSAPINWGEFGGDGSVNKEKLFENF